ncbi:DNA replication/repair protein RecF [Streptococcus sp. DD12]|uniref:DNA replication/repair protein RecF n=1 Tax=Streptococcus sp. DD12 TaxID=1777880 RepID=UPI000795054A|nr:DNA replication/repair protein RecF [Streptococcus sp. DD12]KXT76102.1 DNA recombination and repair protein RecF [Streptococcus sp. DD12]
MWLSSIKLQHFRNYSELETTFSPHLNVFIGDNAQGKTNLLEAIYFLALTRTHRTHKDKELIQFNEEFLSVSGEVHTSSSHYPLDIQLTTKGRMTKVNHLKQAKLSDYIGHLNVVLFAPEDLQLVKGSPSLRRKFMDIDLGQMRPLYLNDIAQYNHVLKQRNAYLKTATSVDTTFLAVLNQQLASHGTRVIRHRLDFVKQLSILADQQHFRLSQEQEHLTLAYKASFDMTGTDNLENDFLQALQANQQRDILRKTTSIGPHRDDLLFSINATDASFGSQGQQRSLILSLKLAEVELMEQYTGNAPLLLLDDVMSELDSNRQSRLLSGVKDKIQTFITTTHLSHLSQLPEDLRVFTIHHGSIKKED